MRFFLLYDVISGYDVTIPVPDVAQIVGQTFFYLQIKFEAELYACWLCMAFSFQTYIFWLFIAPHFVYENDRRKKILYDIMTQN